MSQRISADKEGLGKGCADEAQPFVCSVGVACQAGGRQTKMVGLTRGGGYRHGSAEQERMSLV